MRQPWLRDQKRLHAQLRAQRSADQVFDRHAANLSVSDPVGKDQIRLKVMDVHLADVRISSNKDAFAEPFKVGANLHKVKRRTTCAQDVDGLIAILARLVRASTRRTRYRRHGDWCCCLDARIAVITIGRRRNKWNVGDPLKDELESSATRVNNARLPQDGEQGWRLFRRRCAPTLQSLRGTGATPWRFRYRRGRSPPPHAQR